MGPLTGRTGRRSLAVLALAVLLGVLGSVAGPTAASAAADTPVLTAGETLQPGQQLSSPGGSHRLLVQADGNVVLYGPAGAAWASRTGVPGTRLVMQSDGNLVAYAPGDVAVWHSGTAGGPESRLVVQDDGNAVVYLPDGRPRWASATASAAAPRDGLIAGQRLDSGGRLGSTDGRQVLVMQGDGNLVLYGPAGAAWTSGTSVPGATLVMQDDGNLVVYAPGGGPVWHTRTGGNTGARLLVQDDGNLVVYRPDGLPPWYRGSPLADADVGASTQVVQVVVPTPTATSGRLTTWALTRGGWSPITGPLTAYVGSGGVGPAREGVPRTPVGTYGLTEAFGRLTDPGTALPYRVVDGQDWWVADVDSPLYNQPARCTPGQCPFAESAGEHLYSQGAVYDHAVVIDYNRAGVRGAGSGFFLHITNGVATAGCVAVDRASLVALMRWLTPAGRPVISIGVG